MCNFGDIMSQYKDVQTGKLYDIPGSNFKFPNTSLRLFVKVRPSVIKERSTD